MPTKVNPGASTEQHYLLSTMSWRVLNVFINLSDHNQEDIPKDTLQMDDVIKDMIRVSKLSSLKHPRTGVALLLELLSVKSHTRELTPRYFARDGEKAASRSFSSKVYVFVCPNSLAGSNVAMMPFGGGTIQPNCLFFCSGTLLPHSFSLVFYYRPQHTRL